MSDNQQHETDEMTFAEHIEALRPHLVRSAVAIVVLMIVAFCCKGFVVDTILFGPISDWFPTNRLLAHLADFSGMEYLAVKEQNFQLVNTSMAGQFNLHLSISLATAFAVGFPYLLWEVWRFVKPALTPSELGACHRFVGYVSLGFFVGLLFGYLMISPLTVAFLSQYQVSKEVVNMIDISSYLSTILNVSLACAVVFQLPLLVYFLTRMSIVTPALLRHYRRHALVVLSLLAALITPPDAFSMVLVLLPLYLLYEFGIRISGRTLKKLNQ